MRSRAPRRTGSPGADVPRSAVTGLVTGLALVVVAVLLWPAGAGVSPAPVPAAVPAVVPAVVPAAVIAPASSTPLAAPPVGAPLAPAQPAQVRIDTIAAAAPVVAVGVDERGAMAVPEDVRTVGWYRFGSRPGSPSGSAVLSGSTPPHLRCFRRAGADCSCR